MRSSSLLLQHGRCDAARLRVLRDVVVAQVTLAKQADKACEAARSEADAERGRAALAACESELRGTVNLLSAVVAAGSEEPAADRHVDAMTSRPSASAVTGPSIDVTPAATRNDVRRKTEDETSGGRTC